MGVDATSTIEINRPRDRVAAFLEDPSNDELWIRALIAPAELLTPFPYGEGSLVRRVARMAGAKIDYTTEVVDYEPGQKLVMRTVNGPPMVVTYSLGDTSLGTEIRVRNQGEGGVIFTLFGWLMGRMVKSRVDGDLRQLKHVLEQESEPPRV